MTRNKISLGLLAALALVSRANAADVNLAFRVGDTYSDNVLRVADGGPSDNVGGASMMLDFSGQGARYDAELRSALTYLHYVDNTLDDAFLRGFSGRFNYSFVPGRFEWVTQENYGPVLEDPLSPDRPDNWTYDSYFSTGPDVQFGDVSGFHLIGSARYARADYENADVPGSHQLQGQLSLAMPGSEHSERSLNITAQRVEQQQGRVGQTVVTDAYDRQEVFGRIASDFTRTSLYAEFGGSALHDGGETSTAPLLRVGLERNLSRMFNLALAAGTQYSDNLTRFGRLQDGDPDVADPRQDVTRVNTPMQEHFAETTLEMRGTRTFGALRIAYNELDFLHSDAPLASQEYRDVSLDLRRQLTPRLYVNVGGTYAQRKFNEIDRTDDDYYGYLATGWLISPTLSLQVTGRLQKRNSTDVFQQYTERSVQLELIYQAIKRQTERPDRKIKTRGVH
jgi:hypothetical protein